MTEKTDKFVQTYTTKEGVFLHAQDLCRVLENIGSPDLIAVSKAIKELEIQTLRDAAKRRFWW